VFGHPPPTISTALGHDFDAVVAVVADAETRVRRLVGQRGLDREDVRARMRAQTDDATRREVATHLVVNDGTLEELAAAVEQVVGGIAAAIEDDP
jgi:dephospho-CoA kinase